MSTYKAVNKKAIALYIADILMHDGPCTALYIADLLGTSTDVVYRWLRTARRTGHAVGDGGKPQRWRWQRVEIE